jgi:hypothetical protein
VTSLRRIGGMSSGALVALASLGCPSETPSVYSDCSALRPEVNALEASFDGNAAVSGRVASFVQAAKDLAWGSTQVEHMAAEACRRIGADLGLEQGEMQPAEGPGGVTAGACEPVAVRLDAYLQQGVRLWVTVQPARCHPNPSAFQRCAARCDVNSDPACRASCMTHASVHGTCEEAVVGVRASSGAERSEVLISTLQANLAPLLAAQYLLGQRYSDEANTMTQVGTGLARSLGDAGSDARECAGAAADATATSSTRLRVAMRAIGNVTLRAMGR